MLPAGTQREGQQDVMTREGWEELTPVNGHQLGGVIAERHCEYRI